MTHKILSIIDSCKTYEQVDICRKWLAIVDISTDDRMACNGAMQLKIQQLIQQGLKKYTGENRFPVDDEQQEKH